MAVSDEIYDLYASRLNETSSVKEMEAQESVPQGETMDANNGTSDSNDKDVGLGTSDVGDIITPSMPLRSGNVLRHKPRKLNLFDNLADGITRMSIQEENEQDVEAEEMAEAELEMRSGERTPHPSLPPPVDPAVLHSPSKWKRVSDKTTVRHRLSDSTISENDGSHSQGRHVDEESAETSMSEVDLKYDIQRANGSIVVVEKALLHALNLAKAVSPHDPFVVLFSRIVADSMAAYSLLRESPDQSQLVITLYNSLRDTLLFYADQKDTLSWTETNHGSEQPSSEQGWSLSQSRLHAQSKPRSRSHRSHSHSDAHSHSHSHSHKRPYLHEEPQSRLHSHSHAHSHSHSHTHSRSRPCAHSHEYYDCQLKDAPQTQTAQIVSRIITDVPVRVSPLPSPTSLTTNRRCTCGQCRQPPPTKL